MGQTPIDWTHVGRVDVTPAPVTGSLRDQLVRLVPDQSHVGRSAGAGQVDTPARAAVLLETMETRPAATAHAVEAMS